MTAMSDSVGSPFAQQNRLTTGSRAMNGGNHTITTIMEANSRQEEQSMMSNVQARENSHMERSESPDCHTVEDSPHLELLRLENGHDESK